MFLAMNRFKVKRGSETEFERVWRERDTYLATLPGFVSFALLRGRDHEEYTLYSSHTIWENRAHFEEWTRSDAFRVAHRNAGGNKVLYVGHPELELFESVIELHATDAAA